MHCNVCDSKLGDAIFTARSTFSLTSLCERRAGRVQVWFCDQCGHLQGEPLTEIQSYYATDYRISLEHEDEDQIYEVRDGRIVYRTEHQAEVLLRRAKIDSGASLLDYGCAKASTPRHLLKVRPDVQVHLFDVSDMYLEHWDSFVPPLRRSVDATPLEWAGTFDVLTSFFALEHIPRPIDTVAKMAALLRDGGLLYAVVPDTFGNVADFVVIDHVNHFTEPSLHALLSRAGFAEISVDREGHRGALIVTARKRPSAAGAITQAHATIASVHSEAEAVAAYWSTLDGRIQAAERANAHANWAIYGSGFYGSYIFNTLVDPERVRCFLDRSPFQQGKTLFGKDIVAPVQLPADVNVLFVGLNPTIARRTIGAMDAFAGRNISWLFLDEGGPP